MVSKLKVKSKQCVKFVLYYTIIVETLIIMLHLPSAIRYINDIANIFIFVFILKNIKQIRENRNLSIISFFVILFLFVCTLSACLNSTPIKLYLWAFRNTFRGIIYFYGVCLFLNEEDIREIFKVLFWLQIISCILALYQFYVLHHIMDDIGGIFGYGNGAGVNSMNALVTSYYVNIFLNKREKKSFIELSTMVVTSILVAAIAEEKMTYVYIVLIFIVSVLISKFSLKKFIVVVLGIFVIVGGLNILKKYYPGMYDTMINYSETEKYLETTYDEGYRIPRIGAFKFIQKNFLQKKILFGIGFGNGETSYFNFLQSEFYKTYGDYNYRWFTHQWVFLEEGYIGFISYLSIFIIIAILNLKDLIKGNGKRYIKIIGLCMCVCTILSIWYNATLKVDMQYILYFGLGLSFIKVKNNINKI